MMRKLFLTLSIILISVKLLSQNEDNIRNIVPPTPRAFEIVKYGNMPLNEYQGMAQISIPIAEITDKNIKSSVELNNLKAGVKVADLSNNVGVNWLLQMGGVITRTVYDLPDESQISNRLIFDSASEVQNIANAQDGTNEAFLLNSYHLNPEYDNEIDIFEFSVNGLSGKFYLNRNLDPVLLSRNNPVKIEAVGNFKLTHQFIVTAIDGTRYYFGGENAIENTFRRSIMYYSDNVTSFYLTKIKGVDGNEINFTYGHFGPRSYWLSRDERISVLNHTEDCSFGEATANFHESYNYENNVLRVKNAISLASIISTEKTIKLNYEHITNSNQDKITSIDVINNKNNKRMQKIDFEYLNQYSDNQNLERFFLTKIKKYNFNSDNIEIFDEEYSFAYDNPLDLPERESYSVDAFGFFNGKTNLTFLPNLNLLRNVDITNYTQYSYADRRSFFNFAKTGTLKSITYPTKGTTFFEYEGIDHTEQFPEYRSLQVQSNDYHPTVNNNASTLEEVLFLDGKEVIDNRVKVKFTLHQLDINWISGRIKVDLKILNEITNEVLLTKELGFPRVSQEEYLAGERLKYEDFVFETSKDVKYKFVLSLIEVENINYFGHMGISYPKEAIVKNNIGIRLKKTYDKDTNGNAQNIKRLYYSSYNNIDKIPPPPASSLYPAAYISNRYNDGWCTRVGGPNSPIPMGTFFTEQLILSSSPKGSLFWENYQQSFLYPNVTISYGGDNFEKGGEEKTFLTDKKENVTILRIPDSNSNEAPFLGFNLSSLTGDVVLDYQRTFLFDGYNGKPLEIKQFTKRNNSLLLQSKTTFSYQLDNHDTVYNLMLKPVYRTLFLPPGYPPNSFTSNLYAAYSPLPSYNIALLNKSENIYYDDVPVDIEDDSPYKKLQTITNYVYGNPAHNQLTAQTTTFPGLSTQTTEYQYAHEKGNTYLMGENMVGIPLQTMTYESDILKPISKTETIYPASQTDADNKTSGLPLPVSVSSLDLKTNTMEKEIIYNQYDNKGNIQQYTLKPDANGSGTPVTIIWGYNQTQPIAKIEGIGYNALMAVSGISAIITDLQTKSAADIDDGTELTLIAALDSFRKDTNLSGFQITTYTYNPLIGVTSITPPSGIREVYIYDTANRLKEVREQNAIGNLLKEYQYYYKP